MAEIKIRQIDAPVKRSCFDCGNPRINELVYGAYFNSLTQLAYTYEMLIDDKPIGYYMIQLKTINQDLPEEVTDYLDDSLELAIPCVYIHFIAIDKKLQNNGFGRLLINYIISSVRDMIKYFPIRGLLLKSVADRVPWYENLGFKRLTDSKGFEQLMYLDCLVKSNKEQLEKLEEEV